MAIEPELKELLAALTDGQINLAQGQSKLDTTITHLAEGQLKLETTVDRLVEGQLKLEATVERLAEGQIRLIERQLKLEATVDRLAEGQITLAEGQLKLEGTVNRLAEGQVKLGATVAHLASATEGALTRTAGALTRLTERMDGFREVILKGFTNGAERDRKLGEDVRALDARVTRLERRPRRGPSKKPSR